MPRYEATYNSQSCGRAYGTCADRKVFARLEEEANDQGEEDDEVDDVGTERADQEDE